MNRRDVLASLATGLAATVPGCTSESAPKTTTKPTTTASVVSTTTETTEEATTETVPSTSVTAVDAAPESPDVQLTVQWNARVQLTLDPPNEVATHAETGQKWLVVQVLVENTGSSPWTATPKPFVAIVGGERFEFVASRVDSYFGGAAIPPGGSTAGWLSFQIPRAARTAQFSIAQELTASTISATFQRDDSLSFSVGQ